MFGFVWVLLREYVFSIVTYRLTEKSALANGIAAGGGERRSRGRRESVVFDGGWKSVAEEMFYVSDFDLLVFMLLLYISFLVYVL